MTTMSADLAPRGAPLEYWFLKLHAGDLEFLVDYIVRRPIGQAEMRVSLWVRGQGRVARHAVPVWRGTAGIAIGESVLDAGRCAGAVDNIGWDLVYEPRAGRAAPRVPLLSRLHPFDLELVSRPRMLVCGHVTVAGERFDVAGGTGSVTHYWGRRLPDRWHWISADGFAGAELAVEAVVMRTRLWGRSPGLTVGYLWSWHEGRQAIVISPANGLITVAGGCTDYTLLARRPGHRTRLRCVGAADRYNDLGEGIQQTLHGVCTVAHLGRAELGRTDTRAGLEYRVRPSSG